MTGKQIVREVMTALPEKASVDDIMYALYVRTKFEQGERDFKEGRWVTHEAAIKKLRKWLK